MSEIRLTNLIDVGVLQQIQDGFSAFTGMAALTTDENGIPITEGSGFTDFCMNLTRKSELGCKRCEECDRKGAIKTLEEGKASVYYCHAGLVDFAAPIMVEGKFIGSFIGGQVRTSVIDEASMKKYAVELGIDPEIYVIAAKKTAELKKEEIDRAAVFLAEIAKILSEMALQNYKALNQSQKMEKAARSQSNFMMDMSVSVQNSVSKWMQMAQRSVDNHDTNNMEKTLRRLLDHGKELSSSLDDAIDYMRLSGGDIELLETEYHLASLLEQVKESTKSIIGIDDLEIDTKVSEDVPRYMLGDAGRIGQVISKLVHDIYYITRSKKYMVSIFSERKSYSTVLEIRIENADCLDGYVIDEKENERIHQINRANNMDEKTIGYSMIKLLVRQMSGRIKMERGENGKIVYVVKLPQLEVEGGVKQNA